ncbi:polymeric immunoglobulin receptor-like [Oreochromis aureus]|uniref:polymeric immunoglobulin receptor-like n=1 Tax=Oreochromis aureus TaxID=47969 RepID=UPI001954C96F|nr:polymeric immunoglobulin receptor-like [Oreochromis aureus]
MAAHLIILLLFSVLKGVHSITTVSKVSVKAGKSISIPCLYESQYKNHVKYLCEGYYWTYCRYAVKTNEADPSGKYLISDDKKQNIFNVTINQLAHKNTDYWCAVEINDGQDYRQYFQLSVTSGTPSLYVDQMITGYFRENITIICHHSNSGEMKWCRLGRNCVAGSSGSIDGTTVTTHMRDPNVFTVKMSGLKSDDSGWYWCAEGDIQIPVYLNVTVKPITTTTPTTTTASITISTTVHTVATMEQGKNSTVGENKQHRASFDPRILIIPLSVLIWIVIVVLFIWFILRHKQRKADSSVTLMAEEEIIYSDVRPQKKGLAKVDKEVTYSEVRLNEKGKRSFAESEMEILYSSVVTKQRMKRGDGKDTGVALEHIS